MATSPNYAWAEPDNSSLVKNGAQDIRALGDAIDTSLWNVGYGQAGKNKIINGDFGIWQRGTTITNPGNGGYTADRFFNAQDGTGTVTCTQQTFTPATAPVTGYEGAYFLRTSLTTLGTTTYMQPTQRIEDVRTFAGQTVTVSFWAKADSARASIIVLIQNFGSGGSGATTQTSAVTYSTTWTRYTATFTVGSMSGKTIGTGSSLEIGFRTTAAVGSILDIWGVQVEYGSKATPFQTATGTIQGELAACQRYYYRLVSGSTYGNLATSGYCTQTNLGILAFQFPVTMRTSPAAIETTGTVSNYSLLGASGAVIACTAVTYDSQTNAQIGAFTANTAGSLTVGQGTQLRSNNSTTAYIGWSAEL